MLKAIFYKEWIKSARAIKLIAAVLCAVTVYSLISVIHDMRASGSISFVETLLQKDISIVPLLKYIPLLAGMAFALAQYAPEVLDKRLKLTLHLPMPESNILWAMLGFGCLVLTVLFVLFALLLHGGLAVLLPREIVYATAISTLPWFLGGIAAYLLAAWACIEPVWKQRIVNGVIGLAIVSLFYLDAKSGAMVYFLPVLVPMCLLPVVFVFYSTARFKDGEQ